LLASGQTHAGIFIFFPTICPDLTNHHANVELKKGNIANFFHQKKQAKEKGRKT
jgi:hypothetical protein